MKWSFIDSGTLPGALNMQMDLELAQSVLPTHESVTAQGVFRIYGWDKPTLSLGKNQVISPEIERNCKRHDIPIVHRPTGGRAVLHANELTYCIVMPCSSMEIARQAYKAIHSFFMQALSQIGITDLDFVKSDADFRDHYKTTVSTACFSASARYELTCKGKKLMGSAQRVFDGVLLQHGSLPLDQSYLNIARILTSNAEEQEQLRQNIASHSTCLSDCLEQSCDFLQIASSIGNYWKAMNGELSL
jgi:lipoate-protein ligase A